MKAYQSVPPELREVAKARDMVKMREDCVSEAKASLSQAKKDLEEAQEELGKQLDLVLGDGKPTLLDGIDAMEVTTTTSGRKTTTVNFTADQLKPMPLPDDIYNHENENDD